MTGQPKERALLLMDITGSDSYPVLTKIRPVTYILRPNLNRPVNRLSVVLTPRYTMPLQIVDTLDIYYYICCPFIMIVRII